MNKFIEDGRMLWTNYREQSYVFIGVGLFVGAVVGAVVGALIW